MVLRSANIEKFPSRYSQGKVAAARARPKGLQPEVWRLRQRPSRGWGSWAGVREPPPHQLEVSDFSLFWPLDKASSGQKKCVNSEW